MTQSRNMDVKLAVLCILAVLGSAACKSYEGYKVYQVTAATAEQYYYLNDLENEGYDFLRRAHDVNEPNEIVVMPEDLAHFEELMEENGLTYRITVDNLEQIIQEEKHSIVPFLGLGSVTFRSYMSHDHQNAYLRTLASTYPNFVSVEDIGRSYEGRELLLLRISSGPSSNNIPKPTIFIDAGIHAREWIAPPVALYIIHQLVENATNAALFANVDWAIIPVLNPDGYQFTQVEDRLWRKTRRPNEGSTCYGTDGNRNFDYFWMLDGASANPCAQTFAGPEPFSEPETAALRDWILAHNDTIKLYLTIHSFGSMLLYPWGYAQIVPDNGAELLSLGNDVASAIYNANTFNSVYAVNTSSIYLYVAAGVSADWTKGVAGIGLSYTFELPVGNSPFSFMNPTSDIVPIVEETWAGIRVFQEYIEQQFWTQLQPAP